MLALACCLLIDTTSGAPAPAPAPGFDPLTLTLKGIIFYLLNQNNRPPRFTFGVGVQG
jgi:hypothetical protein